MNRQTWLAISGVIVIATGVFGGWAILPVLKPAPVFLSTKILDRHGGLLYEVSDQNKGISTSVSLEQIPGSLKKAVIATEDARFYKHHGIDWLATARAIKELLINGKTKGASTLEQQLIKNLYFPGQPRTVLQKIREMTAAVYWSVSHSKKETLEKYLNTVYLGNRAFGMAAAGKIYFNKNIQDLTIAESALLAGLLPAPSQYEPYRHWKNARARQKYVLDRMVATGALTHQQRSDAETTAVELFPLRQEILAPHFVFNVLEDLEETYPDIQSGGYTIRTTLDPELQQVAEETVSRRLFPLAEQNVNNSAVIALSPESGEVLAYVGSRNFFDKEIQGGVDMVQAKRQPGSALKPFMYFTALMQGFTPATIISDLPVRFETATGRPYYPRNYNYRYFGPVTLRDALASSLNIPAVKVLDKIGLQSFFSSLKQFGITFPQPPDYYGLGIVLGGGEVSLIDTAKAYASLARYGNSSPVTKVLEIKDWQGRIIYSSKKLLPKPPKPLFEDQNKAKQAAALIADILSDKDARSRSFGEANLLNIDKRVAVKTGTTKDFRDNWAFGYTPEFVLGVWVGNADNSPMKGVSGITGAVPIWHDIMRYRYDHEGEVNWPAPEGLVRRNICLPSGLLATEICPKKRIERFINGTEPTQQDDWYKLVDIDAQTGLQAAVECQQKVVQKTYLITPSEYDAWTTGAKHQRPPNRDCLGRAVATNSSPIILSPIDGDIYEMDSLVENEFQKIPFIAGGATPPYHWVLNGVPIESDGEIFLWHPKSGQYTLSLENRQIQFTVR